MAGKESVTKLANNEEKKKALDAAIAKLEKDFGKGYVNLFHHLFLLFNSIGSKDGVTLSIRLNQFKLK